VNEERLEEVLTAGARRVVVVSAFLQAANVVAAVRAFKRHLTSADC
jgi:thiamine monophosphate synthase